MAQKVSLREQRRAARLARQRKQRLIFSAAAFVVLAFTAFVIYRLWDQQNELKVSATATAGAITSATQTAAAVVPTPLGAETDAEMVTLDGGLQYQDIKVGDGMEAKVDDAITIHYTGWLADGTKFDSSRDRGEPATFNLSYGSLIDGWVEGVAGMKVGGIRKLYIPPEKGYGVNGNPPTIPGNADLVFEVELLGVNEQ